VPERERDGYVAHLLEAVRQADHTKDMLLASYRELCARAADTLAAGGARGQLIKELREAASRS
jgi:hypothetical protein